MSVAEHIWMAVFAITMEDCALDMYWMICSSWNLTAAQTQSSLCAPREIAQAC